MKQSINVIDGRVYKVITTDTTIEERYLYQEYTLISDLVFELTVDNKVNVSGIIYKQSYTNEALEILNPVSLYVNGSKTPVTINPVNGIIEINVTLDGFTLEEAKNLRFLESETNISGFFEGV